MCSNSPNLVTLVGVIRRPWEQTHVKKYLLNEPFEAKNENIRKCSSEVFVSMGIWMHIALNYG
jgi:hypothetical protein